MLSFKKYLSHRLKSTLLLTLILCVLAIIIVSSTVILRMGIYYEWPGEAPGEPVEVRGLRIENFGSVMFILGALCTVIPVLELSGLKNKRNADTIYSLPVSRTKLALAHYISGLIQIFAVYTSAYAALFIKIISSRLSSQVSSYGALIWCYFLLLVAGVAVYSIFMAIFNSANTVADGCLFIGVWSILPALLLIALNEFGGNTSGILSIPFVDRLSEGFLYPHAALLVTEAFYNMAIGREVLMIYFNYAIFWTAIGAICTAVYFRSFVKKRTEEIGDISDTVFGYKVIIPIGLFCMTQAFDEKAVCAILGILMATIAYMIYRRSFKLKRSDIICIVSIVAFTSISMSLLGK